jgi:hypothetical protein
LFVWARIYSPVELPGTVNSFSPDPSIISSVMRRPAMLAVMSDTKQPDTKALNATFVIVGRRSGASALRAPIMIPIELGLANPQMA